MGSEGNHWRRGNSFAPSIEKSRAPTGWNIPWEGDDLDLTWEKTDRVDALKANL